MLLLHFLVFLLSPIVCELTCTNNTVYAKFIKKCEFYASEESYEVYSGETLLKQSPKFANREERTIEYCLDATLNNQYTLVLKDSHGDSWSSGAWLLVEGLYGNRVFKNYMTDKHKETYQLSLYYAIMKNQEWKVQYNVITIPLEWVTEEFNDMAWNSIILGTPAESTSGTQYFRKTFTGLADMAAYELQMNYKYGVIAYINGIEVFRDNMADGVVTPATNATGSYQELTYHGIIRPAAEVSKSVNILAVELHFSVSLNQSAIDFDAFLATYAPTILENQCYVYSDTVSLQPGSIYNIKRIFDFDKGEYVSISSTPVSSISYDFTKARPYINGLRIWPNRNTDSSPSTFKWQGLVDAATATWKDILSITNAPFESKQHFVINGYFNSALYKAYRLADVTSVSAYKVIIYEIQPLICSIGVPTSIQFDSSSYSYYSKYEAVYIQPIVKEFYNCTISPELPNGISLDSSTCTISGIGKVTSPSVHYTLSSTINDVTYTGTFDLEITDCTGTYVDILRTYKLSSSYESFTVKDAISHEVVLEVAADSDQPENKHVSHLLCLTGSLYTITVGCSQNYWQAQSHLYVHALLYDVEYETIMRARYDSNLGLPTIYTFSSHYSIQSVSQWYYKMGDIPSNWYNAETAGWQQSMIGSYPDSTNQIQLYKNTFNVDSIDYLSGFVISLRYKYGCIIYLNNREVFRNGVDGELSTATMAETSYTDIIYHQISLPVKTIAIGDTPSVNYIKQGSNTIAVALIAINANQNTSVFDCALRLMKKGFTSRVFDYSISFKNVYGSPNLIGYQYHGYTMHSTKCTDNHWTITFNNDRREWISSITVYLGYTQYDEHPTQLKVKARNTNDEEWTTLKTVTGMVWSLIGQNKRLWIENNKPYNQYRFEDIASADETACRWNLCTIDLASDRPIAAIPELVYPENIEVYKDIEMGEVYANSPYYYDFSITPALPEGIAMDPNTGSISGTATRLTEPQSHTITAKKVGGETSTVTIHFSVALCTGDKGLITLVARTDSDPEESSYKVYKGKGTSGEVIIVMDTFKTSNAINYGDFCLPHGIYTLELLDSAKTGWDNPAGYYFTVDLGEMVVETGQVPPGVESVTTLFTSTIPFQIEYDDWKLYNSEIPQDSNWNTLEFDDSDWLVKKAADFGPHVGTTAYIRREVTIPDIADYYVLNIRVKYAGGLVAYFNGRKVARFNLADNYDASTEAIEQHDASLFSKFHVILSTVNAVTGKNIIAFEIHRNTVESTIVFDATGIFGVNDCSVVVDTYSKIEGDISDTKRIYLFDLKPQSYTYLPGYANDKIEWIVENLEGSKYNSFGFQSIDERSELSFSLHARWQVTEDYIPAIAVIDQTTSERRRDAWSMDVGLAGFKEFKFEIDADVPKYVYVTTFIMQYCKPSGTSVCPAIGDYPSVGEGQISPSYCVEGMRGYSYRECKDGQLGDVKTDKCIYKEPANLAYEKESYVFVMDTQVSTGLPTYTNIITTFYMQEDSPLPEGLTINAETGEISGIPKTVIDVTSFTVRGSNPSGETIIAINIAIRKGKCLPEGNFESTEVGNTFVYECALQGSYVGTQQRKCILGEKDGEWEKASGVCIPIYVIVIIVIVAIGIIAIIILVIVRSRKTKAVGGVKGDSVKTSKKKTEKKISSKSIQV